MPARKSSISKLSDARDLIRELRRLSHLTQAELAAKLGVSFCTANRWENGRTKPSAIALQQIQRMLIQMSFSASEPIAIQSQSLLSKYFPQASKTYTTTDDLNKKFRLVPLAELQQRTFHLEEILSSTDTHHNQLQAALQADEANLKEILDTVRVSINYFQVLPDRRLNYIYISPGCESVFGYTPEEFKADSNLWLSRIVPEDFEKVIIPSFEAIAAGQSVRSEYRFLHKDGSLRWISSILTTQWNDDLKCYFVTDVDIGITERKQVEEERQRTEAASRRQVEREKLLRTITQKISQSLELDEILTTAVYEVRQMLNADRVLIFQLQSDRFGKVIKESVVADYLLSNPSYSLDEYFPQECYEFYQQGQVRIISNVKTDECANCLQHYLQQLDVKSKLVAPIPLTSSKDKSSVNQVWGLLIAYSCFQYREWQSSEADFLEQIAHQLAIAIHHANLHQQLQSELAERQRVETAMLLAMEREQRLREQEHLTSAIAQSIRQYLDLNYILSTTVEEVRHFLEADRVLIYQFNPDWTGQVVAESVGDETFSIANQAMNDPCFSAATAHRYRRGQIHAVNDVFAANLNSCYVELLKRLQVRATLILPILVKGELWGLLAAHQCTTTRQWQEVSWHLLRQLSTQVAIGIQQAELYLRVEDLNSQLADQVEERTAQLLQAFDFEATLKRITDRVRDSLDESQIMQTAVQELALALSVHVCSAALYDIKKRTSTVLYEYTSNAIPLIQGSKVQMADFPQGYAQLLDGQYFQFCSIATQPEEKQAAILACPILDNQGVLGDLWLFHDPAFDFREEDIRLVQQVANQCAIALRQSRLYQASQAQVQELERLNQLKDDFLSTVSHELRTPVSSIKMAIQMLEIKLKQLNVLGDQFTPVDRYFQILKDECHREISLINDLLDLARLDSSTEALIVRNVDLTTWLPQLAKPFIERSQQQQQELLLSIAHSAVSITTDVTYLERILTELLHNACKYTPAHETITLTVSPAPDTEALLFTICNTGVEIPQQERDRVFEKFYRIPKHDPWKHGGTGLGLALVQKLSKRLGGTIDLTSGSNETCFILQLPKEAPKGDW